MKELLFKRKKAFILYVIACFLPVIDQLSHSLGFALIVGSIEKGSIEHFIKVMIFIVILTIAGNLLYVLSRFMRIRYMRDTILDVRVNAFESILKNSYKNFSKKSKDVYVSNLVNDINIFEKQFFLKLINLIFRGGVYVVSVIILFFLDYKFGIGVFAISIIIFLLSKKFENKTVKLQEEVSENNEKFTVDISNTFSGLEILKLNNIEEKFLNKTLKAVDKVERKKFHYSVFMEGQRSLTSFLGVIVFIGMLVYLLNLMFNGESFTKVAFMIQIASGCIWPISQVLPMFNEVKASANIYKKITTCEEVGQNSEEKSNDFKLSSAIEVKDLKFSYEGKEIFKGTNFKIESGKKYLLKGASGAGKSTLIKLLSMTYDDYEGEILLDGVNYRKIKEDSFNDNISFIYQDVFLFEDTIFNNISLFKEIDEKKVLDAAKKAGLSEFLEKRELGLRDMLMENGKNLSGGERQRISIARAIVKDANILFVDEGTSSLNEELGRAVEDTILSLDSTVIAISHRYYEGITEKYDYVIELKEGVIKQYTSQKYFQEVAIV